jgi:hypothetical protein
MLLLKNRPFLGMSPNGAIIFFDVFRVEGVRTKRAFYYFLLIVVLASFMRKRTSMNCIHFTVFSASDANV